MIDAASWAARLGGETFLAQTFTRSHHHSPGTGTFDALLSWGDLNSILATHRLSSPRLRLARGGEHVDVSKYAIPVTNRRGSAWQSLQPGAVHDQLAAGASLVLDSIEEMHPPIAAAAEALERFVRTPVQVNAYASWTAEEGFGTHWDDHAVVVVQVAGAKRWRLYGPTRQAPGWRDVEFPEEPQSDPIAEVVLREGDILYVPRGWWHAVTADQGEPSLHLSFGLLPATGADFLGWVVDRLRGHLAVRQDAPRFAPAEDQAAYVEDLRKVLLAELDQPGLLARWAQAVDTTHPGHACLSLPYVTAVPPEPGITVRMTCPRAHLTGGEGTVTLAAAGTEHDFAAPARPVLESLVTGEPVTVGDLAERSGLDVEAVAELVSVLVQGQAAAIVGTTR
ncbi:cupin domain-containing protein [Streptomyces triculaminicus]|uniref:cupin domain-containing protein n=1 Tax=Streptomyces triculaminicus TaxID=2816232 RepID=UPI0037AA76DC